MNRRPVTLFLLIAALWAIGEKAAFGSSLSSGGLEIRRATATSARNRVGQLRSQQMALRAELNQVAAQIQAQKTNQGKRLVTSPALNASLRRSQELSGKLNSLAREMAIAQKELERVQLLLLDSVAAELNGLRMRWDQTSDRSARRALIERMKSLRAERDQLRAGLPAEKLPALTMKASDDPEELLEQADALRDSEDKVHQRIAVLQGRVKELRSERDLERRMNDFLSDEAMFDEQDLRVRTVGSITNPGGTGGTNVTSIPGIPGGNAGGTVANNNTGGSSGTGPGAPTSASTPTSASGASTVANTTQNFHGEDGRPAMGAVETPGQALQGSDLKSLEKQLRLLQDAATSYRQRADALESRARTLH